jgi:hypothetical protein
LSPTQLRPISSHQKFEDCVWKMFYTRIRPLRLYKQEDHDRLRDLTPNSQKTHLLLLLPSFPIYYLSSFFVIIAWPVDRRRRRSSQAVTPARATHSRCTPQRSPSRACRVSCFKRPRLCVLRIALPMTLLWWSVLHITFIAWSTSTTTLAPFTAAS